MRRWLVMLCACLGCSGPARDPAPAAPLAAEVRAEPDTVELPPARAVEAAPDDEPAEEAPEAPEGTPAPERVVVRRPLPPLPIDRDWEVLVPNDDPRVVLRQAGELLGDWTIELAGNAIDGAWLLELAATPDEEPILRAAREKARQPLDLDDFLLFLDDVLVAGATRRGERFAVHSGRARAAGILLHPDDVFRGRPRRYGDKHELEVDSPPPPSTWPPAEDGDPPGPGWTMRYPNPATEAERYAALAAARPDSGFASRIASLLAQIEQQGGQTYLAATVRPRERGYLMWGAFVLSRSTSEIEVRATAEKLHHANRAWGLNIPITWWHPDGWTATIQAARQMADAYDVVYATESGARNSNHYDGAAADFVAIGLPRELTLRAPDGAVATFDLSDPVNPRDLSLTPPLIDWIEEHFQMRKLDSDYPHWSDAAR